MNSKVTYLGPYGTTFSHEAYERFSNSFSLPEVCPKLNYIESHSNESIVDEIQNNNCYGILPIETRIGGKIRKPIESLISILQIESSAVSFTILGAIKLPIEFALMTHHDKDVPDIRTIVGHKEAIRACESMIPKLNEHELFIETARSNGQAAKEVASMPSLVRMAAIAPESAARVFNLKILIPSFGESAACTTFLLCGPKTVAPRVGPRNRALDIVRIENRPGALLDVLHVYDQCGINLCYIETLHTNNGSYDFAFMSEYALEECHWRSEIEAEIRQIAQKSISFGAFEVITDDHLKEES